MSGGQFDFNHTPDRALALGIASLVCSFVGFMAGGVVGILAIPLWIVFAILGAAALYYGRKASKEIAAGVWPQADSTGALLGTIFGALTLIANTALVLFMVCLGTALVGLITALIFTEGM